MPVNEILAPSYSKMKYHTPAYSLGHRVRLYFDEIPTLVGDSYVFAGYTDGTHLTGWTLEEIWEEVWDRAALDGGLGSALVDNVEVWTSAAGENTFVGFDPDDYTGITGGASTGVASAYLMWVFQAATRDQFRLTFFDTASASPQRYPVAAPPILDDGTLEWFMLNSVVGFVTQDNLALTLAPSINSGYNKGLAKRYGRQVIP